MNCQVCKKVMTPQDEAAYRNCCEGCWASEPDKVQSDQIPYRAGACYSRSRILENIKEITNKYRKDLD